MSSLYTARNIFKKFFRLFSLSTMLKYIPRQLFTHIYENATTSMQEKSFAHCEKQLFYYLFLPVQLACYDDLNCLVQKFCEMFQHVVDKFPSVALQFIF